MARRGRFGQLPRVSPNLTNTIIAIAREMESQRDRNLMDAWQKGGMFEGQKATDEVVLAHWKERLANVDKNDPLYDTYKNTITQYEYSIAESKHSTAYAQGKIGDAAMAAFYLKWAKKVPKNSEFYRTLQRDAAQFMRAARAKGAAAAARAKEEAYQQGQEHTYNRYEKAGDYLVGVMRQLARSNGLIGADLGTDLSQFDPSDPGAMLKLLDAITVGTGPHRGETANDAVLFHDPITGKAVTGADITAELKKLDPTFDGRVNLDYVRSVIARQQQGQAIRLDRATKSGHATDVNNLKKWQEYTAEIGREANLWPVEKQYNDVRGTFLSTWMNAAATPDQKLAAWKEYSAALTRIAGGQNVDDNTRSRLMAEVQGDGSVNSLAEDFTGLNSVDHSTTITGQFKGDIADTHLDLQRYAAMQQAVAAGQAVWTPGFTDEQGVFHVKVGGQEIGAATLQDVQQASPVPPVVVFVPQNGAQTIPVVVTGANVTAFALDEKGQKVKVTDANPVGSFYDVTIGGLKTRVYSYKGGDGKTYYTTSTPWDDNSVSAHETASGLELNLSAFVPHKDETGQYVYADGTSVSGATFGPFGLTEANNQGEQSLVMNPSLMVYASDPARAAAGPDPVTDFFSPTLAALMSSPEGMKVLGTLKDNPAFQAQLQLEAQTAATDPSTGQIDQGALSQYQNQVQSVTHLQESGDQLLGFIGSAYAMWSRLSTTPTFAVTRDATPTPNSIGGPDDRGALPANPSQLPADQVRNTPFGALGDIFQAGTNLINQVFGNRDENALKLRTAGTIKVPEVPTVTPSGMDAGRRPGPTVAPIKTTVPAAPTVQPVTTTTPPPTSLTPPHMSPQKLKQLEYL